MAQAFNEFVQTLRERLQLDDSYTTDIARSVQRIVVRWLRDYNFPKAVRLETFEDVAEGTNSFALPTDFKKPVLVLFSDDTDPDDVAYSDPLLRREGFVRANADGVPRYYWMVGSTLYVDVPMPADSPNTNLLLYYLSNDVAANIDWLLGDFPDVLFTFCMFRLSSEYGKPELAQIYAALWQEDIKSLAIFVNELNYDQLEMVMHAGTPQFRERYPSE